VENSGNWDIQSFICVDVFPPEVALLGYPMIKFDDYVLSHFFSTTQYLAEEKRHKIIGYTDMKRVETDR
jgi:hypothetical protein